VRNLLALFLITESVKQHKPTKIAESECSQVQQGHRVTVTLSIRRDKRVAVDEERLFIRRRVELKNGVALSYIFCPSNWVARNVFISLISSWANRFLFHL